MPLYQFECIEGHTDELFVHTFHDRGCQTAICACGHSMNPIISQSSRMLWFEEGRTRIIYNLGHEPVEIRSHAQHREAMKKAGVELAGNRRGEKGAWI